MSGVGDLEGGVEVDVERKGNVFSLNNICLQVYNLLVSKSRHK